PPPVTIFRHRLPPPPPTPYHHLPPPLTTHLLPPPTIHHHHPLATHSPPPPTPRRCRRHHHHHHHPSPTYHPLATTYHPPPSPIHPPPPPTCHSPSTCHHHPPPPAIRHPHATTTHHSPPSLPPTRYHPPPATATHPPTITTHYHSASATHPPPPPATTTTTTYLLPPAIRHPLATTTHHPPPPPTHPPPLTRHHHPPPATATYPSTTTTYPPPPPTRHHPPPPAIRHPPATTTHHSPPSPTHPPSATHLPPPSTTRHRHPPSHHHHPPATISKSFLDHAQIAVYIMGWLSKIFKGSCHKVSEGKYNRNVGYGEDTLGCEPSSSGDAWAEIEDIDHAIALSLSEEDRKSKNIVDNEYQLKDDEQLAKAIQESLNVESPPQYPQYGNENIYQPIPFPYSTGFRICAGCNTEIGHGRFLNCMGAIWHPGCFRCHGCNQPICDYECAKFSVYCFSHSSLCLGIILITSIATRSTITQNVTFANILFQQTAAGLIEYRAHPFWIQKYCPFHEHDGTPRCCSCERMEPRETRYVALDDGRKVCLECLDSTIMDTNECQPLYLDIQEFYEGLNMKVEQQVPLLLVERQALNEAMDGDKSGHHHMPETRGLCLSEEQTVSTILSRPIIGTGNRANEHDNRTLYTHAALLLTGSILAHEMMHAWLRLNGYRILSQDVEEGICQVLAHMWLESQIMSISGSNVASTSSSAPVLTLSKQGTRSPFERKLGEFFKHQIESDTSPVYGNGFRAGNQAVLKYGLWTTLEHIRLTGTFPY
ncbi:hypothetical protein HYC85_020543, partial [Camellia sinensis]